MHTVQLVHSTQEGDALIAYMARVSNPNNQNNTENSARLIQYLIKHKHWSPFEMVNMCVEISTTRSIAQQIIRHRSFAFQEFSQRYAEVKDKPQVPQLRRQDTSNRQNSIDDLDPSIISYFETEIQQLYDQANNIYDAMLFSGVAKECARDILPLATPTKLYMNGSLRSWIHYVELRCSNGTQYEHKLIADQCKKQILKCFPAVYKALDF